MVVIINRNYFFERLLMNAYLQHYSNNQNNGSTIPDDPQKIIQTLLRELIKNINVIIFIDGKNNGKYTQSVWKSLSIIYALQSSLNFDEGGKIAENLFTVYEFCRGAILERQKGSVKLKQAVSLLSEIEEAWSQIPEIAPAVKYG